MRQHPGAKLSKTLDFYEFVVILVCLAVVVLIIFAGIAFNELQHHHAVPHLVGRGVLYAAIAVFVLGIIAMRTGARVDRLWEHTQNTNIAGGLLPPGRRGLNRRRRLAYYHSRRR